MINRNLCNDPSIASSNHDVVCPTELPYWESGPIPGQPWTDPVPTEVEGKEADWEVSKTYSLILLNLLDLRQTSNPRGRYALQSNQTNSCE